MVYWRVKFCLFGYATENDYVVIVSKTCIKSYVVVVV